jgi:hypothetical protein
MDSTFVALLGASLQNNILGLELIYWKQSPGPYECKCLGMAVVCFFNLIALQGECSRPSSLLNNEQKFLRITMRRVGQPDGRVG